MPRSIDETRREFLLRLARGAAFVPPALMTLDVSRVFGQKGAAGGGGAAATGDAGAQTGVSPVGGALRAFDVQEQRSGEPWDPGQPAGAPPWSRPPPTQAGR